MTQHIKIENFKKLSKQEIKNLYQKKEVLLVSFEPTEQALIDYVSERADLFLDGERAKSLDARRILDSQEWKAPVITSEVLPKMVLINTSLWTEEDFKHLSTYVSLDQFYNWPAVQLNYEDTHTLLFSFSTFFHHAMVSVTDFCNLRCRGCSYHGNDPRYKFAATRSTRPKMELSDEHYYKYIDQLPKGTDILFCGSGELFVSKKAMPFIRAAAERGLYIRILTNGVLITDKIAQELIELGVGAVIFSIDGHTKEIVEAIRIGVDYDLLMERLRFLIKLRNEKQSPMSVGVHCGWFEEVAPHRENIIKFWENFGVDTLSFFSEKIDWYTSTQLSTRECAPPNNIPCFNAFITPVLLTNGRIAPCTGNFQAEWSTDPMDWLKTIDDAPLKDIIKYYRMMRLDPKSPYRKRCAICTGKQASYTNKDFDAAFVDGFRFTERKTKGEAAFVKQLHGTIKPNKASILKIFFEYAKKALK